MWKREPLCIISRIVVWKIVGRFLKKIKNRTTIQFSNFASGYLTKRRKTLNQKDIAPSHSLHHYLQ